MNETRGLIPKTTWTFPGRADVECFRRRFTADLAASRRGVGTIVAVLTLGENPEVVLVPTTALFALMIVMSLVERVRRRAEYQREKKRILSDEWTLRGMNRSKGVAMLTVVLAQPPLAFFMAYVPPEPSVVGMSMMTVALACGTWAASYLYHTRANSDE